MATIGIFGPTAILSYGVARLWARYKSARWQLALERGLRPIAAGMILAASCVLLQSLNGGWLARTIAFTSTGTLMMTRVSPFYLLSLGAALYAGLRLAGM